MATPGQDEIVFEVLEDGTVKMVTDEVSPPNHMNADKLLGTLQRTLGGAATREKRKDAHAHGHAHTHGHAHAH
jgi:hypothetical protein